jgi:hypothetical protein
MTPQLSQNQKQKALNMPTLNNYMTENSTTQSNVNDSGKLTGFEQ